MKVTCEGEQEGGGLPLIGDTFPEVHVQTTRGKKVLPKDYEGKWFVLFSHPGDFTPVCTTEFVGFAKLNDEFKALNCELIGLSIDQIYAHIAWERWIEEHLGVAIPFPIIADNGRVATMLGMLHPKKGNNTVRAVFVVDAKGTIRLILYYPQEIGRKLDEIVRVVKALQTADAKRVAMPANWPDNELIGDRVIMPPPTDVEAANARLKDPTVECKDWWFCYKKLE
ncbi:MAG: peroxiredoxin [Candidatus Methanofastidiosa archaeon]|nr:peroxiredoxin [Candidatus Methanofastidiosa archaeon]